MRKGAVRAKLATLLVEMINNKLSVRALKYKHGYCEEGVT